MFARRHLIDPETARLIEQRLEHLLLEPPDERDPDPPTTAAEATPRRRWVDADPEWRVGPRDEEHHAARHEPQHEPAGSAAVPETVTALAGRLRSALLSRTHLGVVAALAVVALLAAGWLLLRARPVALASPVPTSTLVEPTLAPPGSVLPSGAATTPSPSPSPTGRASPELLVVHVLGAVRRPGVVELPTGSRVRDALRQAGGLARRADPGRLNLAAPVADGQQVYIGTDDEPAGEVSGGESGGGTSSGTGARDGPSTPTTDRLLDLNAATSAQLEELPGVGPVTAEKIVAWRQEHGRFSRVEELQEVSGIGPKTYAEIAPHCRV